MIIPQSERAGMGAPFSRLLREGDGTVRAVHLDYEGRTGMGACGTCGQELAP